MVSSVINELIKIAPLIFSNTSCDCLVQNQAAHQKLKLIVAHVPQYLCIYVSILCACFLLPAAFCAFLRPIKCTNTV